MSWDLAVTSEGVFSVLTADPSVWIILFPQPGGKAPTLDEGPPAKDRTFLGDQMGTEKHVLGLLKISTPDLFSRGSPNWITQLKSGKSSEPKLKLLGFHVKFPGRKP